MDLSEATLRSVKVAPGGQVRVQDTRFPGFGVTVYAGGSWTYHVRYGPRGSQRFLRFGANRKREGANTTVYTVAEARGWARDLAAQARVGDDPAERRDKERATPTVKEYVGVYLEAAGRRRKSVVADFRYLDGTHRGTQKPRNPPDSAIKLWGSKKLTAVTTVDVRAGFKLMSQRGNVSGNRWLAAVHGLFQQAVVDGYVERNPCHGIKLNEKSPPRLRIYDDDQMAHLLAAIADEQDPRIRACFRLIAFTGCRKGEAIPAKWEDFDFNDLVWLIPRPKAKKPQRQPIPVELADELRALQRLGPYLFPGATPFRHRFSIEKAWYRIRTRAKMEDGWIHDFRRSAGWHLARVAGLHVASKFLRHSSVAITERHYAPLGLNDLRPAADVMSQRIVSLSATPAKA